MFEKDRENKKGEEKRRKKSEKEKRRFALMDKWVPRRSSVTRRCFFVLGSRMILEFMRVIA